MGERTWFGGLILLLLAGCGSGGGAADAGVGSDVAPAADVGAIADAGTPRWTWGASFATENRSIAFLGYDQGCAQYGPLTESGGKLSFEIGFSLIQPAADRMKHYDSPSKPAVDDGPLADYAGVGLVLLVQAVKVEFNEQGDSTTTPVTDLLRLAAMPATSATAAALTGSLDVPDANPCAGAVGRCKAQVQPTIVLVWQQMGTKTRAYQFLRPDTVAPHLFLPGRYADCPVATAAMPVDLGFRQGLGVSWPLREDLAQQLNGAPDPAHWTGWIDEVLPR